MNKDEDDDEDRSVGAVRYPCMPSLVALQQMRNRLHLAYLGKKLMKWTAMATGRELRRLAWEIIKMSESISDDIRTAFILLARGRYFYPNMNKMVLQNAHNQAVVTVLKSTKTISGVKVLHLNIAESGLEPYEHLGIDKGGQAIRDAKKAWLEVLRKLIVFLEQRTSFTLVEIAHKNATKRKNVLTKIIIPRIRATITYIILELEEVAREELYRIKIINQKKKKVAAKKHHADVGCVCPICAQVAGKCIVGTENDDKEIRSKSIIPDIIIKTIIPTTERMEKEKPQINLITGTDEIYLPLASQPEVSRRRCDPCNVISIGESSSDLKLDFFKRHLSDIISLSKDFIKNGFQSDIDINEFLSACQNVKLKLEQNFKMDKLHGEIDNSLKRKVEHLNCHPREVIDVMREFSNDPFLSPSVEMFIRTCEEVDGKLNILYSKTASENKPVNNGTIIQLEKLNSHIKDVIKILEEYQKQGLLTPSFEDFLSFCKTITTNINIYSKETVDTDKFKLDNLKQHVTGLEQIAIDIKEEGLISSSVENFLASCKDFKMKLEEYKNKGKKPPAEGGGLEEIVNHIDATMELSKEVKEGHLISESIDDLIKSCENLKKRIKPKYREEIRNTQTLETSETAKNNIDDMIDFISACKKEGVLTDSVENFVKASETATTKVDMFPKYSTEDLQSRMLYPSCSKTCTCDNNKAPRNKLCGRYEQTETANSRTLQLTPCDFCQGILNKKKLSEEVICESCNRPAIEEEDWPSYLSPDQSQEHVCEFCKKHTTENVEEFNKSIVDKTDEQERKELISTDSTLGYFEKKVRIIIKIKRTQSVDGTIREEKETITIKKERHDPTETLFSDRDEELDAGSYESSLGTHEIKKVAPCITPNVNKRGFKKRSQSETIVRSPSIIGTTLRQCLSLNALHTEGVRISGDISEIIKKHNT